MNNPPDLSICLSDQLWRWIILLGTVKGRKGRIERETRATLTAQV